MAAGSTYTPIATNTVSGSSTSTVSFTSIPSTYTDLVLVMTVASDTDDSFAGITLNSDTGSNYSNTQLVGDGSTATSSRQTSNTFLWNSSGGGIGWGTSLNYPTTNIINFMNYANTTTYKTILSRSNPMRASTARVTADVGLWRSTAAITTITFTMGGSSKFISGSTLTLYGITAA